MTVTEQIRLERFRKMSFAEKWEQVLALRQLAWAIKTAAIKEAHPQWPDRQVEEEVKKIFLYASS